MTPWSVGEPFPAVMFLKDLAAVLRMSHTQAWTLEHAGALRFLEALPRVGKKARYPGPRLRAYLDGTLQGAPRVFGSARR